MDFTTEIEQCRNAIEKCNFSNAGKAIGLSHGEYGRDIRRWVDGLHRPSADKVIALAKHLEVSPQALGAMFMIAWVDRAVLLQGPAPVAAELSPLEARSNCLET